MNRDEGQYFLTHVFDELLEKSPGKNQLATLRQRPKHRRVLEHQSHPSFDNNKYKCTRNVHSNCTFWISLMKFYSQYQLL